MTLDEIRDRTTITVPEAAEVLGISRWAGYRAAEVDQIPTLRLGRRLLVPVPRLLALLEPTSNGDAPTAGNGEGVDARDGRADQGGAHEA